MLIVVAWSQPVSYVGCSVYWGVDYAVLLVNYKLGALTMRGDTILRLYYELSMGKLSTMYISDNEIV